MKTHPRIIQLLTSFTALAVFLSPAISTQAQITNTTTTALDGTGTNDYGTPFTITATITPTPTDDPLTPTDGDLVVFNTNGAPYSTNPITAGVASLSISNLPVGTYVITATFVGDTNYLSSTSSSSNETINPGLVTITSGLTVDPVIYGTLSGLDAATLTSNSVVLAGVLEQDLANVYLVTNGYTAFFGDINVSTNVPVTVSNLTLAGSAATNYSLTEPSLTGVIEPATLTYVAIPATQPFGSADTNFTGTVTGFEYSDTLASATAGTTNFTSTTTTASPVGIYAITGSGLTASNYVFAQASGNATALTISAAPVSIVSGLTATNKVYDGTNTAELVVTNTVVLAGLTPADVGFVTLSTNGYMATFATTNATTNIIVTVAGLSLAGGDFTNYVLTQPVFEADITPAPVTVTSGLTVAPVEYGTLSGLDAAILSSNSVVLAGVIEQDVAEVYLVTNGYTAAFTDINANLTVPVTVSGLSLGGTEATNYSLTQPSLTGEIDPATLTYVANPAAQPFGSANTNFTGSVTGFEYSDTITNATIGTAVFTSATSASTPPGSYAITGSGLTASNYVFAQAAGNASALTITAAGTVTIVSGITATNKVYDGTNTAMLVLTNTVVLAGLAPGDVGVVTLSTNGYIATFVSSNVMTDLTVTVSGLSLTGGDASNYTFIQPVFLADITPASVTVASGLSVAPVVYGSLTGTDAAVMSSNSVVLDGVIAQDIGDVYLVTNSYSAVFTDINANSAVPVTVSGMSLGGSESTNYTLVEPSLTGEIDPATLTYVATPATQPYGSANTNFTGTVTGFEYSDTLTSATVGTPAFTSATTSASPVASYAVTGAGLTASNYIFVQASSNATALTITAGTVSIVSGLTATNKVYDATNTAALVLTNTVVLAGLTPADVGVVTLNTNGYVATFASTNATTNITVSVAGLSLIGGDFTNYVLSQPVFEADITRAPVTITSGLTVAPVVYGSLSGLDAAILSSNDVVLAGVVDVNVGYVFLDTNGYTAAFADTNANLAVPVTVSGLTLAGSEATNYSLTLPSLTGVIEPASLTYLATPASQVYGSPNTNFTGTVTGFVYSDTLSNATAGALAFTSATSATSPPGIYPIDGSGLTASNYVFQQAASNATALTITISSTPVNLSFSLLGTNQITLSWPADHLGWTLQTNAIDLSIAADWFDYPGSTSNTSETIAIDPTQTNVYFRVVDQ